MKRILIVVRVVLLAALVLLPSAAQAEMYVEGYLGGNFAGNASDVSLNILGFPTVWRNYPGNIDPAFQGGVKFGAWFDRSGVLAGINFPVWMKYLGFYLDFSYHRLNFPQRGSVLTLPAPLEPEYVISSSEGAAATLAFMFAFRYGFFPDKDVPFGRLQAYVGVGPAIMWTWQQPTLFFPRAAVRSTVEPDSVSTTNLALAVEAGLRWMCLKNVSLDVSFKYRYTEPTYAYSGLWGAAAFADLRMKPTLNLFGIQLGASYHF